MPNKRQKGMVLISVAAAAIFLFANIFFITINSGEVSANKLSYSLYQSKKQISLAPYCGDLKCDYSHGENPLNCPEDCYLG